MKNISPYPPKKLQYLLLSLVVLHLGFISAKAFRSYPFVKNVLASVPSVQILSEYYTQMTVLQADYSFFSPNISPDYQVSILVNDRKGQVHDAFFKFPNVEVEKRFHTCVLAVQNLPEDLQDIVVKSWAARVYGQHPDAHQITVRIDQSKLPPMHTFDKSLWLSQSSEKTLELVFQTHQPVAEQNPELP